MSEPSLSLTLTVIPLQWQGLTQAMILVWRRCRYSSTVPNNRIGNMQLHNVSHKCHWCDSYCQLLQVVLRIRPSVQPVPNWSKENCIHAESSYTVAIAPPESSQGYKNGDRGQTYNFSRVFHGHTSQEEYFKATAAPLVQTAEVGNPAKHSA